MRLALALTVLTGPALAELDREGHLDCIAAARAQAGFAEALDSYGHIVNPVSVETFGNIERDFARLAAQELGCPIDTLLTEAASAGLDLQYAYEDRIDPETTYEIWDDGIAAINDCILTHGEDRLIAAAQNPTPACTD